LMTCWPAGLPNWERASPRAPLAPGLQRLLLLRGRDSLEVEGLDSFDWSCCSYTVRVNGGGPLAWLPVEPPESYVAPAEAIAPWRGLEALAEWLGAPREAALVNPLSWPLYTPVVLDPGEGGPPGCRETGSGAVALPPLTPLRASRLGKCSPAGGDAVEGVRLGSFTLRGRWRRSGPLYHGGPCGAVAGPSGATVPGECMLEVESRAYDYTVEALYAGLVVGRHAGPRARLGPFQALAVGNPEAGFLALASPAGVEVELAPGRVLVASRGPLRAAPGGGLVAARLLQEALVAWEPVEAPAGRGFGNLRASAGASFVYAAGEARLDLALYNPLPEPGVLEARLPIVGRRVSMVTPLGGFEVPLEGDLARVPLGGGVLGCARVELVKKKLLFRLRRG